MAKLNKIAESQAYQAAWCNRCAHDVNKDCKVWILHKMYGNDKGGEDTRHMLDVLIPVKDGEPQQCSMYHEDAERAYKLDAAKFIDKHCRQCDEYKKLCPYMGEPTRKMIDADRCAVGEGLKERSDNV